MLRCIPCQNLNFSNIEEHISGCIPHYTSFFPFKNIFFKGHVSDAMNKYTEALTASDFSKTSGNVDILVLPVLCNLAACCIQIGV